MRLRTGWLLLGCLVGVAATPAVLASKPDPAATAPASVQDRLERARVALAAGRAEEAIALIKEAIAAAGADKSAAQAYEALAGALYQTKDAAGAVAALKRAIQIDPTRGSPYAALGGIAFSAGRLAEARQLLEQAIKLTPDLAGAHERLGMVLQGMGDTAGAIHEYELGLLHTAPEYRGAKVELAELYNATGRPADAVHLLEPLVAPDSTDKRELLALGNAYLGVGEAAKAVPLFSAAFLLDRGDNRVALALGVAQRLAGLDNAALEQLQQVVKAVPDSASAHYELGLTYLALQKYSDAETTLVRAIQLDPKAIPYRQALGETMLREGKPLEALAVFQELAKADAGGLPAWDGVGKAYLALQQPDKAEAAYRDAVARFPKDPGAYWLLGTTLAGQGKYEEALKVYADGTRLAPTDLRLLGDTALAEARLGRIADAVATARHLVELWPKSTDARFLLGDLVEENGDTAEAIRLYRSVLADNPSHADALNNLAVCLTDAGDARAAVPLARRAMTLKRDNADLTDTLGWALLKSGQTAEALTTLETANRLRGDDPALMYHLAVAEKESGDAAAARATVAAALQLKTEFKEAAAARALLAELSK